jgi:hypothetical protein
MLDSLWGALLVLTFLVVLILSRSRSGDDLEGFGPGAQDGQAVQGPREVGPVGVENTMPAVSSDGYWHAPGPLAWPGPRPGRALKPDRATRPETELRPEVGVGVGPAEVGAPDLWAGPPIAAGTKNYASGDHYDPFEGETVDRRGLHALNYPDHDPRVGDESLPDVDGRYPYGWID